MRPSSTVKPSTQDVAAAPLNPILGGVLTSLDVQLEDELIRYRRQRALGKAGYPIRQVSRQKPVKPLNLISMPGEVAATQATGGSGEEPLAAIAPPPVIPPSPTSTGELRELARQYASQVAEETNVAEDADAIDEIIPDDYLESSEELLKSLAHEEAQVHTEQSFLDSLLTPLGVGSMLLLLLSSALFGFVVMNPSSLTHFVADRTASDRPAPPDVQPVASPDPGNSPDAPQPNLATQEFPDLSLETLGSVNATHSGTAVSSAAGIQGALKPGGATKTVNLGASGSATALQSIPFKPAPATVTAPASSRFSAPAPAPAPASPAAQPRQVAPAPEYRPPARSYSSPPRPTAPVPEYRPPARSYSPPPSTRRPDLAPPVRRSPAVRRAPETLPAATTPMPAAQPPAPPIHHSPSPAAVPSPVHTQGTSSYPWKVVSPFSGDRSLEEARQKSPNAFVLNTPNGAVNQHGAYKDAEAAKARADELRKQGVPAEVYQP